MGHEACPAHAIQPGRRLLRARGRDARARPAASPDDLRSYGYEPVPIETPGRAAFARAQRDFAERAAPLRTELIKVCDRVLG